MSSIGRFLVNTASAAMSALRLNSDSKSEYMPLLNFDSPSPSDVLEVKNMFLGAYALPLDIIDAIIDYAEYWPHTTMVTKGPTLARGASDDNHFVLRSLPLGYHHIETKNNIFATISDYFDPAIQPTPRPYNNSNITQFATEKVLNCWKSRSLPRGEHPCRKVVFTIKSRDQGWGGNLEHRGTYSGSYTWFDAGLERIEAIDIGKFKDAREPLLQQYLPHFQLGGRDSPIWCSIYTILPRNIEDPADSSNFKFDHPFLPSPSRIQSNITADREIKKHIITWSYNDYVDSESLKGEELEKQGRGRASATGEFVRNLQVGDTVTVWARARFPGWMNQVEEVILDVYWAV